MPTDELSPATQFPNLKIRPDELKRAIALWVRFKGYPCSPGEVRLWVDPDSGLPWAEVVRE